MSGAEAGVVTQLVDLDVEGSGTRVCSWISEAKKGICRDMVVALDSDWGLAMIPGKTSAYTHMLTLMHRRLDMDTVGMDMGMDIRVGVESGV